MRRRGSGTPNAAALASSLSPLPPLLASPSLTHLAVPAVVLTAMRGSMAVLSLSTPWGERGKGWRVWRQACPPAPRPSFPFPLPLPRSPECSRRLSPRPRCLWPRRAATRRQTRRRSRTALSAARPGRLRPERVERRRDEVGAAQSAKTCRAPARPPGPPQRTCSTVGFGSTPLYTACPIPNRSSMSVTAAVAPQASSGASVTTSAFLSPSPFRWDPADCREPVPMKVTGGM